MPSRRNGACRLGELSTEPSVVVHKASNRRIGYGEIAAFATAPAELPKIEDKDLKPASQFRLIGKDVPRVEVPLKVTGAAKYGMDVQVPGMVYAAVLQSPYPGGRPDRRGRGQGPAGARHHRRREAAGRRRRDRHQRRGDPGRQEPAQGRPGAPTRPGAHLDSEQALEEFAAIARDKSRDGAVYKQRGRR